MAQQLLQASYGVDVVFLAPRIIFPRNEGVTHNGDDALVSFSSFFFWIFFSAEAEH